MKHQGSNWFVAVVGLAILATGPGWAADKSGVSPNTISLPNGPGSVEGLGESFQPTLNTGTAKYGLGLTLSPGTAGHQPSLALSYDGGGANGPLGYGWSLSPPRIQRRTDQGIPTYGEHLGVQRPDRFLNDAREELVPMMDGFWYCENESAFVRYRFVPLDSQPATLTTFRGHWEAQLPDGTKQEFGLTASGRIEDGVAGHIFSWLLERETDTRGNVIEYVYRAFPGGQNLNQKYLSLVRYGPGAPPWTAHHFVAFEYEDRADWFEDGRAGFLVRTGKRLKSIAVGTQGVALPGHLAGDFDGDGSPDFLNRRYVLDYLDYAGAGSHWSLLAKVTLLGADDVTALPPATFDYAVSDPPAQASVANHLWGTLNEPLAVMDNELVDLIDLNADGLPDILKTEAGGGAHSVAVNRGPVVTDGIAAIQWSAPLAVDPGLGTAWNFELASDRTHLADMDGDGLADLVHKAADESVFFFANEGRLAWGSRQDMTLEGGAPPAPFGSPDVRTADVDFDKRIDVIQSLDLGGGVGYRVWFNLGDRTYAPPFTIEPEGGFDFALPGVQVADCNGDRVPDVARIQPGAVNVAAGLGYGRFAPPLALSLPDYTLDSGQLANAKLTDINGDGLADLVLERGAPGECWYWLNLGNYTLSPRKVLTGLPALSAATAVRWADLNGNGTTDLVYADAQASPRLQMVELGELVSGGLAPNLLKQISNGIGRVTEIIYEPSTTFALEDVAAGQPWPDALPFPVTVVSEVRTSDSLGHEYLTRFRYHDGYYDATEKQFRGFACVEQIDIGDATAPTLVSRSEFDTGREHDAMKGKLLAATAETESGEVFTRDTTAWAEPPRLLHTGTNGVAVRFAHPLATAKEILELGQGPPRRLESEPEFDDFGNQTRVSDYGIVENGDRSAFDDERITVTEFALNLERWILRRPRRQSVQDEHGVVISKSESFYDDETFAGNNPGQVTVGNLTLRREWIDPANPAAYVNAARARYDPFGNTIVLFDPLADGTGNPAQGHFRELTYDERFHSYPLREALHLGEGKPELVFAASYDEGFGTARSSTDFNAHLTTYGHDPFGRLIQVVRPGDSEAYPTTEYEYVLALPTDGGGVVNYVETRQRDQPQISNLKSEMYLHGRQFSDGLGRALMTRTEAEPAPGGTAPRVVVSGASRFNARLKPARALNPFFTTRTGSIEELLAYEPLEAPGWQGQFHEAGLLVALDLDAAHQTSLQYDATLRTIQTTHPDGTFARTEFAPLITRSFDENDNDPASPHFATPMVSFADGLGRLIEVNEVVRLNDDGTTSGALNTWITRYAYDLNNRLTHITDSQDNVKELRYDGLRRKVWMSDPDAGISTNVYDAASNLLETTDAKGQRITYTYDGVNRLLTEDYHDDASAEFSYGRSPDVAFHYDAPAGLVDQGDGTTATVRNVRGTLAWVEDPSGEEHSSFDERGRIEWTVKRIPDPVLTPALDPRAGPLVAYRTAFEYDPQDRVTRMVYPDNDEVTYRYNARSLLDGIVGGPSGHILSALSYLPSAQQQRIDYGNGVRTTYTYDARQRLASLATLHEARPTEPLIHFDYDLDPVSNIRAIVDQRPTSLVPADSPRRNTQHFQYDDRYRLTRVQYNLPHPVASNGGEINYRYDRIGNLLAQSSDLNHVEHGVPVTDVGDLAYGGTAGRTGRAGRQPNDPPGPHALSQIQSPNSQTRSFPYDASGNLTEIDGLRCTWDFRDRLVAVEDGTMRADYRYDYTGRRILKRVIPKASDPGPQTPTARANPPTAVVYPGKHFEVRDHDQPMKYVFNAATRVAKITSSLSTNLRVQRLRLHTGWNLCSIAVAGARLPTSPAIQSAHLWNPAGDGYALVGSGQILGAGAVVWIKAVSDVVISLTGQAVEPTNLYVPAGQSFLAGPGLEVWPLDLPTTLTAWHYHAVARWWQHGFAGDLATLTDLPHALAPGEAIFVRTDSPVELAVAEPEARILYYHQDHLTSSSVVTDRAGNLVEESANYPFGSPRHVHALADIETHYSFGQKERDRESALHYFEARYLASAVSRFASVDPKYLNPDLLSDQDLTSLLSRPQNINLYAYVANNPLTYVDPTGLDPMKHIETAGKGNDLIGAFTGGVETFAKEGGKWMKAAKVAGPVTAVIGVGVKTAKFANDPNADTASELSWEVSKAAIGTLNPVAGVAIYVGEQLGLDIGKGLNWAGHKIGSAMAGPTPLEAMQEWKREQRFTQRTKAVHQLQQMIAATKKGNQSAQEVATFLEGVGQTEDARGLRAKISQGQEEIKNYEQQIQNIYRSK